MEKNTYLNKIPRVLLTISLVYGGFATSQSEVFSLNGRRSSADAIHHITYPLREPTDLGKCNVEAIAYAAAITELNDARRVADEAYRRWYDCEMQGGGNGPRGLDPQPKSSIPAAYETGEPQWSILVDSIPSS